MGIVGGVVGDSVSDEFIPHVHDESCPVCRGGVPRLYRDGAPSCTYPEGRGDLFACVWWHASGRVHGLVYIVVLLFVGFRGMPGIWMLGGAIAGGGVWPFIVALVGGRLSPEPKADLSLPPQTEPANKPAKGQSAADLQRLEELEAEMRG